MANDIINSHFNRPIAEVMTDAKSAADRFTDQLLVTLQSLNSWGELRDGILLTANEDMREIFSDENTTSNVLFGVVGEEIRRIWKVEEKFRPDLLREVKLNIAIILLNWRINNYIV